MFYQETHWFALFVFSSDELFSESDSCTTDVFGVCSLSRLFLFSSELEHFGISGLHILAHMVLFGPRVLTLSFLQEREWPINNGGANGLSGSKPGKYWDQV